MRDPKNSEADHARAAFVPVRGKIEDNRVALMIGLGAKNTPKKLSCCMMLSSRRPMGCKLGGLRINRRMTAAPNVSHVRGFSFGGIRVPGSNSFADFMTGAPGGKPSGLLCPIAQSANLPGVAHPLAGVSGSHNLTIGARP